MLVFRNIHFQELLVQPVSKIGGVCLNWFTMLPGSDWNCSSLYVLQ